jgi:ABC-2 type transport system permease protein
MLNFVFAYIKNNLQSAMEYRVSFIIQSIGMFVNDIAWIAIWLILFSRFNSIGGWTFNDMLLLYSLVTIPWGINGIFFGNWLEIGDIIVKGKLDFYLALPKPVLLHLLISKMNFSAVGDLLFGIVLIPFAGITLQQLPLLLLFIITASMILLGFSIVAGSLPFFMGSTGDFGFRLTNSLTIFAMYPFGIFEGLTKVVLLLVIPTGFITGIPVQVLRHFDLLTSLAVVGAAVAILLFAVSLFHIGLRRYESGSLINVRI